MGLTENRAFSTLVIITRIECFVYIETFSSCIVLGTGNTSRLRTIFLSDMTILKNDLMISSRETFF